jgi:hypothetical protein
MNDPEASIFLTVFRYPLPRGNNTVGLVAFLNFRYQSYLKKNLNLQSHNAFLETGKNHHYSYDTVFALAAAMLKYNGNC